MAQLSNKKSKAIAAKGRMMKARCHIGMNGLHPRALAAFQQAFEGSCIRPEPSDVIRVKVHKTFRGNLDQLIKALESTGAVFIVQEGAFLTFWKSE